MVFFFHARIYSMHMFKSNQVPKGPFWKILDLPLDISTTITPLCSYSYPLSSGPNSISVAPFWPKLAYLTVWQCHLFLRCSALWIVQAISRINNVQIYANCVTNGAREVGFGSHLAEVMMNSNALVLWSYRTYKCNARWTMWKCWAMCGFRSQTQWDKCVGDGIWWKLELHYASRHLI